MSGMLSDPAHESAKIEAKFYANGSSEMDQYMEDLTFPSEWDVRAVRDTLENDYRYNWEKQGSI
ncbi:MAG: hypothetical protein ABFD83_10805 [Armatimonadota bacterium]